MRYTVHTSEETSDSHSAPPDTIASKTFDDSTLYSLQNKAIKQPTYT